MLPCGSGGHQPSPGARSPALHLLGWAWAPPTCPASVSRQRGMGLGAQCQPGGGQCQPPECRKAHGLDRGRQRTWDVLRAPCQCRRGSEPGPGRGTRVQWPLLGVRGDGAAGLGTPEIRGLSLKSGGSAWKPRKGSGLKGIPRATGRARRDLRGSLSSSAGGHQGTQPVSSSPGWRVPIRHADRPGRKGRPRLGLCVHPGPWADPLPQRAGPHTFQPSAPALLGLFEYANYFPPTKKII